MWCNKTLSVDKFNDMESEDGGKDYFCKPCRIEVEQYKKSLNKLNRWSSKYKPENMI